MADHEMAVLLLDAEVTEAKRGIVDRGSKPKWTGTRCKSLSQVPVLRTTRSAGPTRLRNAECVCPNINTTTSSSDWKLPAPPSGKAHWNPDSGLFRNSSVAESV